MGSSNDPINDGEDMELPSQSKLEEGHVKASTKADHDGGGDDDDEQYPKFTVVILTMISIMLALFLTALDRTIVGVAIPAISNEFNSFNDISWYESAFLLTTSLFQLPMGKLFKYFSEKWLFVASVAIFEIGSIVCAAAPTSVAFIIGRAITGIGAAGTSVGSQVNIRHLVPVQKRPKYQGFLGAVFGVSSIIGPLVGGQFTTNVTWRWCFWLSLPIGGVALVVLVLVLPAAPPPDKVEGTPFEILMMFDPIGNLFLAPGVICLLLGLQWGGITYPWNSARIIALLVVGSVLLVAFGVVQCIVGENATVPPRIARQRSIAAVSIASFGIFASLIIVSFYLPIWFQAVKGTSAATSGVNLLPYFLVTVAFVMASGFAISKLGYYTPFLIAGSAVTIVGTGLLTTLRVDTSTGQWVGYQILVGVGLGTSLQQGFNVAQTVLNKKDLAPGLALLSFSTSIGGTIFVSVAQTVLSSTLRSQLAKTLPGFDASTISSNGATTIRDKVNKDQLPIVLQAYNAGIDNTFYCALGLAFVTFIASFFVEWRSVKETSEKSSTTID